MASCSGCPYRARFPEIGGNCHELRIVDRDAAWRIVYYVAKDAIVLLDVFSKKTQTLPRNIATAAKRRLKHYLRTVQED
jgi:phage-related protein